MEISKSNVEIGKKKYEEAIQIDEKILRIPPGENENQVRLYYQQKLQLLLESAKYYIQAVEEVKEENLKVALIYLANQSSDEAAKVKTILIYSQQLPGKPPYPRFQPSHSQEKKQLEKEFTLYSQRLLLQAHINHLEAEAQSKPTQAILPTPQEIVKDLINLEDKMQGIGLKRMNSDAYLRESIMQQSIHLSSQLGESFMVLDTKTGSKGPNASSTNLNSRTVADQANRTLTQRGGGSRGRDLNLSTVALPANLDQFPNHQKLNQPQQDQKGTASLALIPPNQTTTTPHPSSSKQPNNPVKSSTTTNAAATGIVNAIMNTENEIEKEVQLESVQRLLQAIATLRDENTRLEEENLRVRSDMNSFKQEYEKKFEAVRPLLESIQAEKASAPKPDNTTNQTKAMKTSNSNNNSTVVESNVTAAADKASNQTLTPEANSQEAARLVTHINKLEKRQEGLQAVIEGLMSKYYNAKSLLQQKDAKLATYEELLKQKLGKDFAGPAQPPSSPDRSSSSPSSPTSHSLSSSTSSMIVNLDRGETEKRSRKEGNISPPRSSLDPNRASNITTGPGMPPNIPPFNRRQNPTGTIHQVTSHASTIYRHPSVSTLQCLQAHSASKTQK